MAVQLGQWKEIWIFQHQPVAKEDILSDDRKFLVFLQISH